MLHDAPDLFTRYDQKALGQELFLPIEEGCRRMLVLQELADTEFLRDFTDQARKDCIAVVNSDITGNTEYTEH